MLILDIPRLYAHGHLEIPPYHRPHVGLRPGAEMSICLLPILSVADPVPTTVPMPEFIVSPIAFERWGNIWRLELVLRDRPGLLADAFDVLKGCGINVLSAESTATEHQSAHHLECVLDIPDLSQTEEFGANTVTRSQIVAHLETVLQAALFDDLCFLADGTPGIKLRPVGALRRAYSAFFALSQNLPHDSLYRPIQERSLVTYYGKDTNRRLGLQLPQEIRGAIRQCMRTAHAQRLYYLRMSDTRDRFLKVVFFRANAPVIHVRLEYRDRVGALSRISRTLQTAGFNIITLFSSIHHPERSRTELVLQFMDGTAVPTSLLKDRLRDALRVTSCADLELSLGYPSDYSVHWSRERIQPALAFTADEADEGHDPSLPALWDRLEVKRQALVRKVQSGRLDKLELPRWNLLNRLLPQIEQHSTSVQRPVLFLSCHFHDRSLIDRIKAVAESDRFQFEVITGEHLEGYDSKIEGLVDKMRLSSHFLGVWSQVGSIALGEGTSPSPWLLWELGVANATGLTWRLLIAKTIRQETWARLSSERQHLLYTEHDFDDNLERALSALCRVRTHSSVSLLRKLPEAL